MAEGSGILCWDPGCGPEVNWAAPSVAAALAVAAGAGVEAAALGSGARFSASRLLSASAVLLPTAAGLALCGEVLLADASGAVEAAGGEGSPTNAPASACSSRVSAVDTGSAAECSARVPLGLPASVLALASSADASVVVEPSVGVAASDWASVAEKSPVAAAGCAVVPGEEAEAADEPAARRPERESAVGLPDSLELVLPFALLGESAWAAPELPWAEDPAPEDCAGGDAEESERESDAAREGELAPGGATGDDGAEDDGAGDEERNVSTGLAAMG